MDTRSAGVVPFHCLEPPPTDCRASAKRSQVFLPGAGAIFISNRYSQYRQVCKIGTGVLQGVV